MVNYTETIAFEYEFPHIKVYKKFRDDIHYAWHLVTDKDYVMYDINANDMDYDEEGNAFPTTYYYTAAHCPLSYNFDNFSWAAVPRNSVPEDKVFGE